MYKLQNISDCSRSTDNAMLSSQLPGQHLLKEIDRIARQGLDED